jgi:hypothetical protein
MVSSGFDAQQYFFVPLITINIFTLHPTMTLSSARIVAQRSAQAGSRRAMSANAKVWIDKDTRVICQGFTGKQVRRAESGSCTVLCDISLERVPVAEKHFEMPVLLP